MKNTLKFIFALTFISILILSSFPAFSQSSDEDLMIKIGVSGNANITDVTLSLALDHLIELGYTIEHIEFADFTLMMEGLVND